MNKVLICLLICWPAGDPPERLHEFIDSKPVRQEVGLSEGQSRQISALIETIPSRPEIVLVLDDESEARANAAEEERQKDIAEINRDIWAILKEDQQRRCAEVILQVRVWYYNRSLEMYAEYGGRGFLTEEQKRSAYGSVENIDAPKNHDVVSQRHQVEFAAATPISTALAE